MSGRKIGFVGLGVMGGPMVGHLLAAGNDLTVYNRTRSKADDIVANGAIFAELPELAQSCDLIFLCVSRTEDVRQCLEAMGGASAGTLFVDHSTISPTAVPAIAEELKSRGQRFVDAPITGGSMGAAAGKLTVFMGGLEADCEEALGIIKAYSKRAERVGPSGSGQMAKMANQIAVAGSLIGLCESLSFASKAGLNKEQMMSLLGGGAGASWAFDNYGPKILAHDWTPGFTIRNQRKDFGYCREAAAKIDAAIPGAMLVDDLLAPLEQEGHGDWTTAALFERLLELSS